MDGKGEFQREIRPVNDRKLASFEYTVRTTGGSTPLMTLLLVFLYLYTSPFTSASKRYKERCK